MLTQPTPQQWNHLYSTGKVIAAYVDDPAIPQQYRRIARRSFAEWREQARFAALGDAIQAPARGVSRGKLWLPYRFFLEQDPARALKIRQQTGDCVSHGSSQPVSIWRCSAIRAGQRWVYHRCDATALIYAARGHGGQGMSGSQAAKSLKQDGCLLEDLYLDGKYDFTNYYDYYTLGMKWGPRGAPEDLKEVTRSRVVQETAWVEDMDSLADYIAVGGAASCCSSIGVSSAGGFISRIQGSWSHCMSIIGVDDRRKYHSERLWIWDQTWGDWNRITNWPKEYGDRPEGAFVLTDSDTWRAVKQGETFVPVNADGVPLQRLPHFSTDLLGG